MARELMAVGSMFFGSMFIGTSIYFLIAAIRAPRVSPEEQQRADMRSPPWPSHEAEPNR